MALGLLLTLLLLTALLILTVPLLLLLELAYLPVCLLQQTHCFCYQLPGLDY